jgi:hypothetical protein
VDFTRYEIHLGSWIPQAVTYSVNFTESGNFKNADPKSHHTDADLRKKSDGSRVAGLTQHKVTMTKPTGGSKVIGANLNIDWWVRRGAAERDPNLATLEAQHTTGLLEAWKQVQNQFGSYSTMFGGGWATLMDGSDIRNYMSNVATYQANTMDRQNCAHDYKLPY